MAAPVVTVDGFTLEVVKVQLRAGDRRQTKSRVYVWPEGESVLDNFCARRNRPVRAYRAAIAAYVATTGVSRALVGITRAPWSQRAGCACGCSPGFVLPVATGDDYHVTVRVREAQ